MRPWNQGLDTDGMTRIRPSRKKSGSGFDLKEIFGSYPRKALHLAQLLSSFQCKISIYPILIHNYNFNNFYNLLCRTLTPGGRQSSTMRLRSRLSISQWVFFYLKKCVTYVFFVCVFFPWLKNSLRLKEYKLSLR